MTIMCLRCLLRRKGLLDPHLPHELDAGPVQNCKKDSRHRWRRRMHLNSGTHHFSLGKIWVANRMDMNSEFPIPALGRLEAAD